ncbi:MAG: hypothetical protein ACE145_11270 [Terriglobia bacterium]
MKKLIAVAAFFIVWPACLSAQEAVKSTQKLQAYVFIGPLVSNARYEFNPKYYGVVFQPGEPPPADLYIRRPRGGVNTGFGGELLVHKGLGVGVEFAYAGPDWRFGTGDAVGVGSANASYHFVGKNDGRRVEPFVMGGYSLYFGDRTSFESGFNLGGGVNVWMAKHIGLRLEIRDQDHINRFHSQFTRFVAFRIGVTFR